MTKLTVFLFIIFIAVFGYLAILNKESVTLKLGEKYVYEIPKVALILLSTAFGALTMLLIVTVRDARRYIENWQNLRREKKTLEIQESYARGMDDFIAGRYEEAEEVFKRILEGEPDHLNSLLRLGDIAFRTGDMVRAKEFYMRAKEIRPRSIEILFSLEKIFEAEKRWHEALRYLDNILEMDEGNPVALYRKREIYEINRNWEALLDVQYKILKSDISREERQREHKNLLGYKYELGRHYLERADTDRAKKVLRTIAKLDKNFIAAHLALAESYLRDGEVEEAEETLIKGYEATSSLIFLLRLEDLFIAMGEPQRIIDLYHNATRNAPDDPKLQFFLARLYYRLEMIDYAFERAMVVSDSAMADSPGLHALLGNIYEKRMQYAMAAQEFKKTLGVERPPGVSFCCSVCSYIAKDFSGRCPECKSWNTFILDLDGTCRS